MLSHKQKRAALKKNIEHARGMARRLRAEGITLTHYADEESFRAMKRPEEGDDFEYRKLANAEFAKVMVAHGLPLKGPGAQCEGILRVARGTSKHIPSATGVPRRPTRNRG